MNATTLQDLAPGATLSRSNGYSRGGDHKYFLVVPIPGGRLYTGAQGTAMEYSYTHRFSAANDAEAQEHAAAYLAKRCKVVAL